MSKYLVWRDQGITIAGQLYRHGETVDSDALVPKVAVDAKTTDEEKKRVADEHAVMVRSAQVELQAAVKDGLAAPVGKGE